MGSNRVEQLMEWYEKCQTRLKKAPPGRLVIHRVKEKVYYYWRTSTGDKYLKPDDPLINLLAQKTYDQDVLRTIRQEMRGIQGKKCKITKRPEDCYYQLAQDRRALIEPIALNDEDFVRQWQSMRFPENPLYKKKGEFRSNSGVIVRSKSELLIVNGLEFQHRPFHYEPVLELDGVQYFPDFLVLNPRTRKEYYWEHFGRMDDPEYADRSVLKMKIYAKHGYDIGKPMIYTMETKNEPLSTAQINGIIEKYLK